MGGGLGGWHTGVTSVHDSGQLFMSPSSDQSGMS